MCVHVYVCIVGVHGYAHAMAHMWRSEANLGSWFSSFTLFKTFGQDPLKLKLQIIGGFCSVLLCILFLRPD